MGLNREEKEVELAQIRAKVDKTHDRMGVEIDPEIRETIAYLWALGFKTSASCEGHPDRGGRAPWINIRETMPKISPHNVSTKEMMLRQIAVIVKKISVLLDRFYKGTGIYFFIPHSKEMQKEYKLSQQRNLREQLRFMQLLKKFYRDRNLSDDAHLIIQSSMGRLISQGARFQEIRPPKEKEEMLQRYQEEMWVFTSFLKNKYYEG